jgi:hypothetical protein
MEESLVIKERYVYEWNEVMKRECPFYLRLYMFIIILGKVYIYDIKM